MAEPTRRSRGRPRLDDTGTGHSPRIAVRLSDQLNRQLARRAAEEGRSVSDALRAAVSAWSAGPTVEERAEIRRLVRLSDRQREQVYLASNRNVRRLIELAEP
jgi:Arc/MetJ-type ribon-helix-helix transcriptional regulator